MLFLSGIILLIVSLAFTFIVILLSKLIFEKLFLKKVKNLGSVILLSFIFLSIFIFITNAILPLNLAIEQFSENKVNIFFTLLRILLIFLIIFIYSTLIIYISFSFFTLLTRDINELKEINENNNYSLPIICGTIILVSTLIVKKPFSNLIDSLVPANFFNINVKTPLINTTLLLNSVLTTFLYIFITILSLYLVFLIIQFLTKEINENKLFLNNNISISIFYSSIFFNIFFIINNSIEKIYQVIIYDFKQEKIAISLLIIFLKIIVSILIMILLFIISYATSYLLNKILIKSKFQENLNEDKINKILLFAILIIIFGYISSISSSYFIGSLISAPPVDRGLFNIQ